MRGRVPRVPQRVPGSSSLRDRFSTRQRLESRKTVRKPTNGRPPAPNASKTSTHTNDTHQSSRPGDPEKKSLGSTRPDGPSRRVPMKASVRGNRLRPPTKQVPRGRYGDRPPRPPHREGPQRFRKPNLPRPRNDRNQRSDNRRDQRNFNDRSYQNDAPENYGHQGHPVQSTKDLLFKGPKKAWQYREEDLKKIKVDIRPSLSDSMPDRREANMFDQAELKKLKVDIKGENFDSKREDIMYRDSHGVPYDKKVLESVKVNIKRKLGPEVIHQSSHSIKRDLELDKFCVPQYKEHQMLNSRPTFTHTSSSKEHEKRDLSMKVNIVRQVANPSNEPLRDEFHEDSFKMYRRQDVSPSRGNRKVIVEQNRNQNHQFRDNQEYHHESRKFQTWQDEGSKPVFSNKNVTPNSVHLADIFPSERDRRESHSHSHPRLTHLDGPPQKFSDHDRDRHPRQRDREGELQPRQRDREGELQPRQRDREGELHPRQRDREGELQPRQRDREGEILHDRRPPHTPSKEPAHYSRPYSGKPYGQTGPRALLPTPGEEKRQPLQSSDTRSGGDYEMGRSTGGGDKYRGRHEVQKRDPSPPPPPSLRPYDNYKPSDRPGRRSRSRSPLRRSPVKDSRDYPTFSSPRGARAPSPRKRPMSPRRPVPVEDKYRDRSFIEEKYRDKPFGDDKYRSDRPNVEEKFRTEKPIFGNYQDKLFGDDKFREKPFGGDTYRSDRQNLGENYGPQKPIFGNYRDKPFGDDKFREELFGDDKYRSSRPEPSRPEPTFEDAYRKPVDRSRPEDKYRPRLDQDRIDKVGPFGDKYGGEKPRSFENNYRADMPIPYEDKYRPTEKPARSFEEQKLYRNDQPVQFGDNYRTDKPSGYEDKYRTDKQGTNYREDKYRQDKPTPSYNDKFRQDKLTLSYNDKFRNDKTGHYDDKYKNEKTAAPFQDNYRTDSRRSGGLTGDKYDSGSRRDLPPSASSNRVYSPSNGRGGERRRNSQEERRGPGSPRPPFSTDPKKNRDYYLKHSGMSGGGLVPGVGQEQVTPMQLQMIPGIPHPGVDMGVFSPFMRPLQQPLSSAPPSYNVHTPYRPNRK